MKPSVNLATAIMLLFSLQANSPNPCQAAPQKSKVKKGSSWPMWYRYDQQGLNQWNIGKKDDAAILFKKALVTTDATLGGRRNLDPVTKKRLREVLSHQLFLIGFIKKPSARSLHGLDSMEQKAQTLDSKISQYKEKIRLVERVKRIHIKYFGRDGKNTYMYDRAVSRLRVAAIQDKAAVERIRDWPVRSYDNGGKFSKDQYFHINKDGTTTSISKPTEAALNRNNPNYDENTWVKKNNPAEKKSGSHYRGLRGTLGHHAPEWYRTNKNSPVRVDRSDKNRYKKATWQPTMKGAAGYTDAKDTRKKAWGDARRKTTKHVKPAAWGSARAIPKEVNRNRSEQQTRHWGQGPAHKKTTSKPNRAAWGAGRRGKVQKANQTIPKQYLKKQPTN